MKIAYVITTLAVGGAERQVVDLASRFDAAGHEVIIIYLTGQATMLPKSESVPTVSVGMNKSFLSVIRAAIRLRKILRDFAPDVVHSHMVHANLICRLLRPFTRMPLLISTAHSVNEGGRIRMLAYRLTDYLADISTNVSQEAVNSFVAKGAVPAGRMIPIHNGIDTDSFSYNYQLRTAVRAELEAEESQSVILAVGRLTPAKDYHNLLNGFASVVALRPDTVLWIAGVGPLEPELRELGANLGIHKKVRFLGLRKDVHALMSAADVFVLSSAWEGFGLVVAEAMACERTVVATDCGGVREVLGENGWLVPPRSSEELAEALNAALSQDQSRQVFIGQNARTRIKELYSIAAASERWARLYTRKPLTF